MNQRKTTSLPILIVLLLMTVLPACSSGPSDAECEAAWSTLGTVFITLDEAVDLYDSHDEYIEGVRYAVDIAASEALNSEYAPDTVGFTIKACIQNGWDYRAASGLK